ncbi:MAG: calcium/sodium antiporter [Candidatus Cloacimonadaceae bacterium]|nr:calcium/sodium antiporter [Candidatus Cloacimonadaceae bacterium]
MIAAVLYLILGVAFLILGANWLVKGASSLAKRFDVPQIVIGLTVVAFGTSAPELVVNIISSIKGAPDIVFGNVIGSNNFNILIVLGFGAIIFPMDVKHGTTWKEIPFALIITLLVIFLVNDAWFDASAVNVLSRIEGFVLLLLFGIFLAYNWHLSKAGMTGGGNIKVYSMFSTVVMILAGMAGLVAGGELLVRNAIIIAHGLGISEKVIGLTIVAAGTSLPELVTSAVAAFKKQHDIALGNVIGSNVFNLLFVLGVSSMIDPPRYQKAFNRDFGMTAVATALLFVFIFLPRRHRLGRWEGALLLVAYAVYAVFWLN